MLLACFAYLAFPGLAQAGEQTLTFHSYAPITVGPYGVVQGAELVPSPPLDGYVVGISATVTDTSGVEEPISHIMLHHVVLSKIGTPDYTCKTFTDYDGNTLPAYAQRFYAEGEERILVTCIDVLSPSNKRQGTKGWRKYVRKRQAMLLGEANFIEIDLLRGGQKFPMLTPWPDSPYTLLVCRRSDAGYCRVWPAHWQRRLPAIPVPLSDPDPDLTLDLQPLLDGIYSLGRYDERVDYTRPLTPSLSDGDAAWVRELLKDRLPPSPTR